MYVGPEAVLKPPSIESICQSTSHFSSSGRLRQYEILTCVRDTFNDPNPLHEWEGRYSGVFKQLVEWLEYSLMHGTNHFMFYTFKGTGYAEKDVLDPYLDAGVASRVHFNFYPEDSLTRFGYASNDCLYRAKNHAKWLFSNVDVDEYMVFHRPFTSRNPTLDIMSSFDQPAPGSPYTDSCSQQDIRCFDFDALLQVSSDLPRSKVRSLRFSRVRFGRAQSEQLEISSMHREERPPRGFAVKHVVNVELVSRLSIHGVVTYDEGTDMVDPDPANALIHHYRLPYDLKVEYEKYDFSDPEANMTDLSLAPDLLPLTEAIQRRFRLSTPEEVGPFLEKLIHKPLPTGK